MESHKTTIASIVIGIIIIGMFLFFSQTNMMEPTATVSSQPANAVSSQPANAVSSQPANAVSSQPANAVSSQPGISFVPPVDNTNINTGSRPPAIDGAATVAAPVPVAAPTIVGPLSGSIRAYNDLNFKGAEMLVDSTAKPKTAITLGKFSPGNPYEPLWKSMRVTPGSKLQFTLLDAGPGFRLASRTSFATAQSDVPDIYGWMRNRPRISGPNNWGYGSLDLNKPLLNERGEIQLLVLSDEEWKAAINSEYGKCIAYVTKMKATDPSRYSFEDCASLTPATFSQTYT
jgi:hypothetical protein